MGSSVLPPPFVLAQPTRPLTRAIPGHTAGPPCYARPWRCVYSGVTWGTWWVLFPRKVLHPLRAQGSFLLWQREVKLSPTFAPISIREVSSGISTLCHLRKKAQAYGNFLLCLFSLEQSEAGLLLSTSTFHDSKRADSPYLSEAGSDKGEWGTRLKSFILKPPCGKNSHIHCWTHCVCLPGTFHTCISFNFCSSLRQLLE